jgi:hypothetical protein
MMIICLSATTSNRCTQRACLFCGIFVRAVEGDAVALYADSLCLDGKKLTLSQILHVENLAAPVVAELLAANAAVILRNLGLFGRPSLALDLILGRVDRYDGLAAVRQLFADRQPDFSAIMPFVGRGEGLTPAFDDLLSGMILADRYLNLNQILIPDSFWTEIRARTTRQSVQQLQFASAGVMSLRFENFLQLLTRRLIKAHEISRILDYGHSSGTDILCGIWLYLAQRFTIIKNHSQGNKCSVRYVKLNFVMVLKDAAVARLILLPILMISDSQLKAK